MSLYRWVPALLDRRALHDDRNTGEQSYDDGDKKADVDEGNLDLIAYDPQQECANSQFAHPDDHNPCDLAKQFILDGLEVYSHIADISRQSSQPIAACNADEDGVKDMKDLGHVSFHTVIQKPMAQPTSARQHR